MGLELGKVHNFVRDEESQQMILQSKAPYKRFVKEGDDTVIIQSGGYYSDGGDKLEKKDIPKYIWDILRNSTEDGLKAIGLTRDDIPSFGEGKPEKETPKPGADQIPQTLQEVLMGLDHSDDTEWTKAGLPDLNVVKERFGRYQSRQQVSDAIEGFKRQQE